MKNLIRHILKEETNKFELVKNLIYIMFDNVTFLEYVTKRNEIIVYYQDSSELTPYEICNTISKYTGLYVVPWYEYGTKKYGTKNNNEPDFYIDTEKYEEELNENYSPAGKEVTPNNIVVHKSNPRFRDNIMSEGLKAKAGECYRIYAGYGEKCVPAIFATNSTNKRAWFDSTYDDDIWEIDTTMIPDVKWFKDRHYDSRSKHIVTFQNIPKEAITLKHKGTGNDWGYINERKIKNEVFDLENPDEVEKNLKIINLLLSQVSWDGLCDIWVEYNEDDKEYEIRSKSKLQDEFSPLDEIQKELDFLDNSIRSMGIRPYIFTPWYVKNCKDEVKFMNESKEKSTKELITSVLNTLVLPQYERVICGFELKNVDDESLNNVINYPKVTVTFIGGYGTKMWPQTQAVQKMYDDVLDDIWETVWDYTGISLELYSKYVRDCGKENIYLREQKEETNYLGILKDIVEPFKKDEGVCDIDMWYDDEDGRYSVYLIFGTEELNDKFTNDGKYLYIRKKIMAVNEAIKSYLPIDNLFVGSYGKPNCGWKSNV